MTAGLYDIVSQDRLRARKARDLLLANLLTVVVADVDKVAKDDGGREPTDGDTIAVLKKFLKGIKQNLELRPDDTGMQIELAIIESYLPSQMNEDQILAILTEQNFINIGSAMSFFKMNYAGEYDNTMLSSVVKAHLVKK